MRKNIGAFDSVYFRWNNDSKVKKFSLILSADVPYGFDIMEPLDKIDKILGLRLRRHAHDLESCVDCDPSTTSEWSDEYQI